MGQEGRHRVGDDKRHMTEWEALANAALLEAGFVDGKYGTVPYTLVWPENFSQHVQATTFSSAAVNIMADGRKLGWIHVRAGYKATVYLDLAKWFKYDSFAEWTIRGWETVGFGVVNKAGVMGLDIKD